MVCTAELASMKSTWEMKNSRRTGELLVGKFTSQECISDTSFMLMIMSSVGRFAGEPELSRRNSLRQKEGT